MPSICAFLPVPLWQYIMKQILDGKENRSIIESDPRDLGLVQERICTVSGLLATQACDLDPGGHKPSNFWFVDGKQPTQECDIHELHTICLTSAKIATPICPDGEGLLETRCLLFMNSDSLYWDLTQEKRDKYLPGLLVKPDDFSISQMTVDMENYFEYYCDVHTAGWFSEQQYLLAALAAANDQITASSTVLSDSSLALSVQHQQDLQAKIQALISLVASENATTAAIEQLTLELKVLTDTLVSIYTAPPEPTPTPLPPPTPTPLPEPEG